MPSRIEINVKTGQALVIELTPAEIAALAASTAPPVPYSVTPRQVRLLLLRKGLLPSVTALIATQSQEAQIAWEYATEFKRDDPLLLGVAQALNLTSAQLDEFFIEANQI